ncbi:pyridoxamine 5'-phosphate oxidase family protein [Permianibacter sp. IMCC34836]|uniref:pyridoxamine 5'-phosphate oxidase family protein n=1 Tax=Permianibacter fluminis TaxID=2738515 RepID=UPI0015546C0A|nr:pyridoxamine 5'-phosphate oxidase family protein [Permianibacter fluminis]NQD36255.1 pyridoxamine 5'-phosphate oxidase family protein [Permianibacter fluminis]
MTTTLAPHPATRVRRHPERASYDRAAIDALLDAHWVCQIAFVHDQLPHVIPTAYWRDGDYVYIHGSNGSRMLNMLQDGDSCTNITLIDGMVLARSAFSHSVNYRSVNLYGRYQAVTDAVHKAEAFQKFFDVILPGRWPEVRPPNHKETAATTVLRLPIEQAVLKARSGGPKDDQEDLTRPCWAGVLPFSFHSGAAIAEPDAVGDLNLQADLRWRQRW